MIIIILHTAHGPQVPGTGSVTVRTLLKSGMNCFSERPALCSNDLTWFQSLSFLCGANNEKWKVCIEKRMGWMGQSPPILWWLLFSVIFFFFSVNYIFRFNIIAHSPKHKNKPIQNPSETLPLKQIKKGECKNAKKQNIGKVFSQSTSLWLTSTL